MKGAGSSILNHLWLVSTVVVIQSSFSNARKLSMDVNIMLHDVRRRIVKVKLYVESRYFVVECLPSIEGNANTILVHVNRICFCVHPMSLPLLKMSTETKIG